MRFEEDRSAERIGEKSGFAFSYFAFTTILFYALTFGHKLPASWSYAHVAAITLAIVAAGLTVKRLLR